jgi:hypothetical protein
MRVKAVTWPSKRAATSHLAGAAPQYLLEPAAGAVGDGHQVEEEEEVGTVEVEPSPPTRRRTPSSRWRKTPSSALVNLIYGCNERKGSERLSE